MDEQTTSLENRAVERLFAERRDFIIIGLTGRTGCGCTSVANLLCKTRDNLQPPLPRGNNSISDRSDTIIYNFSQNWKQFRLIEMKHVIFTFILDNPFERLKEFILKRRIEELEDKGRTVTLPRNGQMVEVTFKKDELIGTLTVGTETCQVYLGSMEAHQCGREYERYLGKPAFSPGHIARKFVLIEA